MSADVTGPIQTGLAAFNTLENSRDRLSALKIDCNYLQKQSPRFHLIRSAVQKKVDIKVATPLERQWLNSADQLSINLSKFLGKLDRVMKHSSLRQLWDIHGPSNVARKAKEMRTGLENLLAEECAQEIAKAISNITPVIQLLGDQHTESVRKTNFDEFWGQFHSENVQVIGIHGMIGIGKSTFLKQINDHFYPDGRGFDMVVFVPQSPNSKVDEEVQRIQDEIANRLGYTLPKDSVSRQKIMRAILSHGKVLLLLDNLLHGVTLSSLGIPLSPPAHAPALAPAPAPPALPAADPTAAPDNQPPTCKVVFTARTKLPGRDIGVHGQEIELDLLDKEEARRLFKKKVWPHHPSSLTVREQPYTDEFGKTKRIEDIANEIADMCGGLPLALDKIGGHLKPKSLAQQWMTELERLCEPERASDGDPEGEVYASLKEAYDSLKGSRSEDDPCEKKSFLYCSVFPKGHALEENELKRHWMVEEFLGKVRRTKALNAYFNRADSIFETLKGAYLLSSSIDHQSSVTMHSQFHCMARWIEKDRVRKENFGLSNENLDELSSMSEEHRGQVKRILFTRRSRRSLGKIACPKLSTFVMRNSVVSNIGPDLFESVEGSLKVLDLASCTLPLFQLNDVKMTNLQYLNLSHTNIESFPFDLTKFSKLKLLDLSFMERLIVTSLKDLSVLTDLQLLNFYYCGPCGQSQGGSTLLLLEDVEKLNHLGDLAVTICGNPAFEKLKRFSKLNLTHSMVITNCDDTALKLKFIATAKKLQVLHVIHCSALLDLPQNAITPEQCFVNLCNVEINDCVKLEDLTWLKYAGALQLLRIAKCPILTKVIDSGLPGGTEANEKLFDKLRNLELTDLEDLSSIFSHDLLFSSLERIIVRNCEKLGPIPIAENIQRKMQPEIECQRGWWDRLGDGARKSRLRPVFRP